MTSRHAPGPGWRAGAHGVDASSGVRPMNSWMGSRLSRMPPSPSNTRRAPARTRPAFDRTRPEVDHIRTEFDHTRPEFDHTRPEFDRSRPRSAVIRAQHSSRRPNPSHVASRHSLRLRSSSIVSSEHPESRPETRGAPTRGLRKPLSVFAQRHSKPPHPRSSFAGPLPRRRRTRRELVQRLPTSQEPTREFPDPHSQHGQPTRDFAEPLTRHKWAARRSPRGRERAPRRIQPGPRAALSSRTADARDFSTHLRIRSASP